jgi:hypothetical protein
LQWIFLFDGHLGTNGFMAYLASRGDDMESRHQGEL